MSCSQRRVSRLLMTFFKGSVRVKSQYSILGYLLDLFSEASAAGDLRASLETAGRPIGPDDLAIATQAPRMGATMVTANVSEFRHVDGLSWQDWMNPAW